jgi:hypothetical protein
MSLFGSTPKDYNSIVAPLKRIEGDLKTYVGEKKAEVKNLNEEKTGIDQKIATAQLETKKSEHTVAQIGALLATDFNGDGQPDFVEPPAPPEAPAADD